MSQPQPLNYASPPPGERPLRKKAIRHCRGNGVASLILGLIVGLSGLAVAFAAARAIDPAELTFIAAASGGAFAVVYIISGIIHLIASFKLRQPNPTWEKLVIIAASIHIGFIAIWIGLLIWAATRTGSFGVLPFIISLVVLLSLAKGINSTRQAATET